MNVKSESFHYLVFFCSLGQISKKDAGVYEVVLKDDRGKDTSTLNLKDQGRSARRRLGYIQSSRWFTF